MPIRVPGGREGRPTPADIGGQTQKEVYKKEHLVNIQELDREGKTKFKIEMNEEEKSDYEWLNTTELETYIDSLINKFFTPKPGAKLKGSDGVETQYLGNCRRATRDFGDLLNSEPIGGEKENFFTKYQGTKIKKDGQSSQSEPTQYYDLQKKLPGGTSQEDFHSIGFISIPHPTDPNKGYYAAIDLTHHATAININARVLMIHGTGKNTVMQKLSDVYRGGKWDIFRFDPNFVQKNSKDGSKGTFVFEE